MAQRKIVPSNAPDTRALEEFRRKVFADKSAYRGRLAKAPIDEKLRILEEMRDFTLATRYIREQNKTQMARAWATQADFTAI